MPPSPETELVAPQQQPLEGTTDADLGALGHAALPENHAAGCPTDVYSIPAGGEKSSKGCIASTANISAEPKDERGATHSPFSCETRVTIPPELTADSPEAAQQSLRGWRGALARVFSRGGAAEAIDPEANAGFGGAGGAGYDPREYVILRVELSSAREVTVLIGLMYAGMTVGVASLLALFVTILAVPNVGFDGLYWFYRWMAASASIILAAMLVLLAVFTYSVCASRASNKRWTPRRRTWSVNAYVLLLAQTWSVIWWLVPNVYVLLHPCKFFVPIITVAAYLKLIGKMTVLLACLWSVHNTTIHRARDAKGGRVDVLNMDRGWLVHWPELGLWAGAVGLQIAMLVIELDKESDMQRVMSKGGDDPAGGQADSHTWVPGEDCSEFVWNCKPSTPKSLKYANFALMVAMGSLAILYFARGANELQRRPYMQYRLPNLLLRITARTTLMALVLLGLSVLLLDWTHPNSCSTYAICLHFGFLPHEVVGASVVLVIALLFCPKSPHEDPVVQTHLSEFAWPLCDAPAVIARRNAASCSATVARQPLFVVERALQCCVWSKLVYAVDRAHGAQCLDDARALLPGAGPGGFTVLQDPDTDSCAVVLWRGGRCVLAFRGTASLRNVMHDLRALQKPHGDGPARGGCCAAGTPNVHTGFYESWRGTGGTFAASCLGAVQAAAHDMGVEAREMEVVVTGHSLGGALAQLAALDLTAAGHARLTCYTLGAPRVGNAAFCRRLDAAVADLWNVTNDKDIVCHRGNLFFVYARAGQRCILTASGDVLVRPTVLENTVNIGGSSMANHLLSSYEAALTAACAAQFVPTKQRRGGPEGVAAMAAGCPVIARILQTNGLSFDKDTGEGVISLPRPSSWVLPDDSSGCCLDGCFDVRHAIKKLPLTGRSACDAAPVAESKTAEQQGAAALGSQP